MRDSVIVDPDSLGSVARSMVILSADMQQARTTIQGIDTGDFGHPVAQSATADFVNHWSFQGGRLAAAVQDVGDELSATVKLYRDTETGTSDQIAALQADA